MAIDGRALLVAVEEFDSGSLSRLRTPISDADQLAEVLRREDVGRYQVDAVVTNPDRRTLVERLHEFFDEVRDNEVALVHIATHGLVDAQGNLYLATSDSVGGVPNTALSAADLAGYVRACRCPRVLVILDCCYSARALIGSMEPREKPIKDELRSGAAEGSGSGKVIIASSFARGRAYENDDASVLTGHLITGLSSGSADLNGDGVVTAEEMFSYLEDAMSRSDPPQAPRMLADIVELGIRIALNPQGPRRSLEVRYRELLGQASGDPRVFDDLGRRYLIDDPFNLAEVRERVAWTVAYWANLARGSELGHLRIVRRLQRDHEEKYADLFTQPIEVIAHAIESSRPRSDDLRSELRRKAEPWRMIARADADSLRRRYRATTEELEALCRELGIEFREPDRLVALPPVAGAPAMHRILERNRLRHVVDLIWAADAQDCRIVGAVGEEPFGVVEHPGFQLDQAAVAAGASRSEDPALRPVWTELRLLTPAELVALLRWQIAEIARSANRSRADVLSVLLDAGVIDAEARRVGYAVSREPRSRDRRFDELRHDLDAGRLYSAHRRVAGRPGKSRTKEEAEALPWLQRRVLLAEQLRESAREQAEARAAWPLLDHARDLVSDLPELDDVARRFPPEAPGDVTVHVRGAGVEIRWRRTGDADAGVRYRVGRKSGPAAEFMEIPARVEDGCRAYDDDPPAGRPLWYCVTAERGFVASETIEPAAGEPVHLYPPVHDLQAAYDGSRVTVSWSMHPDARSVIIRRLTRHSAAVAEFEVEIRGDGYADDGVEEERTYLYEVSALYHGDGMSDVVSAEIVTDPIGEPVSDLAVAYARAGWLSVQARRPNAGSLVIAFAEREPPPVGTVVRGSAFLDVAEPLVTTAVSDRVELAEPDRGGWFCAVTVVGDNYTYGARTQFVRIPVISGRLVVRRRGDRMQVCWPWPPELVQAEVVTRPDGGPEQRHAVTRAAYQNEGGVWLPSTGAAVSVEVQPVGSGRRARLTGIGLSTRLAARPVVRYTIAPDPAGAPYSVAVTVTAEYAASVARLVAVASARSHQPIEESDGAVVWSHDDLELSAGESSRFTFTWAQAAPGPAWIRCFAPNDDVELLDPPVTQQRRRWARR